MPRTFFAGSSFLATCGALVILMTALIMLFGPWIAPYGENQIVGSDFEAWNDQFLLGTDFQGRDYYSLLILGTRTTVGVALLATLPAFLLGSAMGFLAGIEAGWVDRTLSWAADTIMAVPPFIWFITLVPGAYALGNSLVVGVCAVIFAAPVFRLARALARNALSPASDEPPGVPRTGTGRVFGAKLWPRVRQPLAVEFGLRFCSVYMFINAASFLGIGIKGTLAEWVSLMVSNTTLITFGDFTPLIPVVPLIVVPLSVHFLINAFRHPANEIYDTLNLEIALPTRPGAAR
jgi:peptide/nickel transport system permease protein